MFVKLLPRFERFENVSLAHTRKRVGTAHRQFRCTPLQLACRTSTVHERVRVRRAGPPQAPPPPPASRAAAAAVRDRRRVDRRRSVQQWFRRYILFSECARRRRRRWSRGRRTTAAARGARRPRGDRTRRPSGYAQSPQHRRRIRN